jgi:SAM-dependent methyltransferase
VTVKIDELFFPETRAGGFSRFDGTVQFYTRINALLSPEMTVLDLGAGRGEVTEGSFRYNCGWLITLQGKAKRVVGVDIDQAVLNNPYVDDGFTYDGLNIPLDTHGVDLIVCDNTLEHVDNPERFASEVSRVLRPGGWLCARTPNLLSLLVIAATLVPNRSHANVLKFAQPGRQERDIFPTRYKLNSRRALERYFTPDQWLNCSYTFSSEPAYNFNNPAIYRLLLIYQYLKKPFFGGEMLMVFLKKR